MMVPGRRERGEQDSQAGPDHYPLRLGQGERSGDPKRYAFLVSGKEEKGISAQAQLLHLFFRHRTRIVTQLGYIDENRREFVLCLNCDMRNADITPDDLLLEIRQLKFIRNARVARMANRLFDGFFFPLTFLENRVILLDSQISFLIEHELKTPEQKAAITEVGRIYALDIIRQVQARLPPNSPEKVLRENVLDYFKAAGIGRFSLIDSTEKSIQAVVHDPPVSEKGDATGNHFIHGIVVGLIEVFQERETRVVEDLYDPKSCRLFIVLLDNEQIDPASPSADGKVMNKALAEVEKVINSIEGSEKPPLPVQIVSANSSATLNQVLKTYEKEGWIGGKIGYVPESQKDASNPPIVVRYEEGRPVLQIDKSEDTNSPMKSISQDAIEQQPSKEIQSILAERAKEKPRKKTDEEEEEDRLRNALRSALAEDDFYFDQQSSSFLE